jgi:hypothetical protein
MASDDPEFEEKATDIIGLYIRRPVHAAAFCVDVKSVTQALDLFDPGFPLSQLDPFFERTSKLASRRLKREIERRGTLGEFALEPDPLHLKRIPSKESGSDLFRTDGPDAVGGSGEVESPQSVVQGCPAQGGAVGSGEKES